MKATHITFEGKTNRQRYNMLKKAINIAGMFDSETTIIGDKTIKRRILDGENIMYNDGHCIIECDDYCLYVDYSTRAIKEWFGGVYLETITNI